VRKEIGWEAEQMIGSRGNKETRRIRNNVKVRNSMKPRCTDRKEGRIVAFVGDTIGQNTGKIETPE